MRSSKRVSILVLHPACGLDRLADEVMKMMVGDNLTDEQLQQLVDREMRDADLNQDGLLSFEEFMEAVRGQLAQPEVEEGWGSEFVN